MPYYHPSFDVDRLDSFINVRGETVTFYSGRACDCVVHGHPSPDCAFCFGTGFAIGTGVGTTFLITGVKSHLKFIEAGILEAGDLVVTIAVDNPYLETVKPGDRLKLDLRHETREEVLARGDTEKDALREPYVVSVVSIVQGATIYLADTDYTVSGNEINWVGVEPDEGTNYTVTYKYNPVYVIFGDLPFTRTSKGVTLPRRLGMRRLELR